MIKKLLGLVLVAVTISLIAPSFVSAAGNMKLGPIKVNPYVSSQVEYTTNAFSSPTDRVDDTIYTNTPGVSLDLSFRKHLLHLDYNVVDKKYKEYNFEDTTDENGYARLDIKGGSKLNLTLSDTYKKGHEPRGVSATGEIEKFKSNTIDALLKYALVDISSLELGYSGTSWKFKTVANDFRERDEQTVSATLYFKVLPKTSILAEYARKDVGYEIVEPTLGVSLDNDTDFMQVGIKWDATDKSTGIVKVGYSWKEYDEPTLEEYNTWVGSLEVKHNFDKETTLTLTASRSLEETSLSGTRFMTSTGGSAELKHKFYKKFSMAVRGSRTEDRYSDPLVTIEKREDTNLSVGAGFGYTMGDSATLLLDYDYSEKTSNEPESEYIGNIYSAKVELKF